MSSPVSVTVADMVVEIIEQRTLIFFSPPPILLKKYVDGLLPSMVESFHQNLNSIEPLIQLWWKWIAMVFCPFLTSSSQEIVMGLSLSTSVNCKQIHTDQYLQFYLTTLLLTNNLLVTLYSLGPQHICPLVYIE